MSRSLRIEYPGALYHVTSRGDAPVQSCVMTRIGYGYTLSEIGRRLGIHYTTVSKIIKASKKNR
jgi:hypothetical protein